jgi:hypothetical protein
MEIKGVINIFDLSWVNLVLQGPKILLVELSIPLRLESVLWWMVMANLVLLVDGLPRGLGETLSVEVLTCHLRYVTSIAGHMLRLDIAGGATDPILSLVRVVAELKGLCFNVLQRGVNLIVILLEVGL